MGCDNVWPCCCGRSLSCSSCDSNPLGDEYEYAIIARHLFTYYETNNGASRPLQITQPEDRVSFRLNGSQLPLPPSRGAPLNSYGASNFDSSAIYVTDLEVVPYIRNLMRCTCMSELMNVHSNVLDGTSLLDSKNNYIISKSNLTETNNNIDLRISSPPFQFDLDATENMERGNDPNYWKKIFAAMSSVAVIRFKNLVPQCICSRLGLSANAQSIPQFETSTYVTNLNYSYYANRLITYRYYFNDQNCYFTFDILPLLNAGNIQQGYGLVPSILDDIKKERRYGKGQHAYFDLCFSPDEINSCEQNQPDTISITVNSPCLGTQSAEAYKSLPLYKVDNSPAPRTYSNCGQLKQFQVGNKTYYLGVAAELGTFESFTDNNYYRRSTSQGTLGGYDPFNYNYIYYAPGQTPKTICGPGSSKSFASYAVWTKFDPFDYLDEGQVPNATEQLAGYIQEFFVDDEDYNSIPQNPVVPDYYKNPDGTIKRWSVYGTFSVGDPLIYMNYDVPGEFYVMCENGQVFFDSRQHENTYLDHPLSSRDEPVFCEPFVCGPSPAFARTFDSRYRGGVTHKITNISLYNDPTGKKTYAVGSFIVNGQMTKLKARNYLVRGTLNYYIFGCHQCRHSDQPTTVMITP